MGALVKLSLHAKNHGYLKLAPHDESVKLTNSPSHYGLNVSGGEIRAVSKNEKIEGDVLEAGKKYRVYLGSCTPSRYHAEVLFNPELKHVLNPTVSFERLEPGTTQKDLGITFTALKNTKVDEISHWITIYLLD